MTTPVLYAPVVGAAIGRIDCTMPEGMTVADIVAQVVPVGERDRLRVVLVDNAGAIVVDRQVWARTRPKAGVRVVIRAVPREGALRSVLQLVVTVAAVALGQAWAVPLASAIGIPASAAAALITVGVSVIGSLLLNALIPPAKPDPKEGNRYAISSFRNSSNPDGPIPDPHGEIRYAPYYAAPPFTEIVGDVQYIRALFVWGYGPLEINDLKLGDTAISEYDDVQIETYQGWPGDPQVSLYWRQVIEEGLNVELTRAWQLADDGSYLPGGHTVEKAVVRYTASDATEAQVILGFPGGLVTMDTKGKRQIRAVGIRIRQRPVGGADWSEVAQVVVQAKTSVPMWRAYGWTLPYRGAWEVELTRMNDESQESSVSDRTVWQSLQSIRPEYPISFGKPLALTALRIKATANLNGTVESLSGRVRRIAATWDQGSGAWAVLPTRSPAARMRRILQGPANAYPVSDDEIDLAALAEWSVWCESKGLYYDVVGDESGSMLDALLDCCRAGRASPRYDGRRWSVVIDRPQDLVVDHITPRNARDFSWSRAYTKKPDGFRIAFVDRSNDWRKSERIIPWPGHTGDVVVTEALTLPGKTDPAEIWIEARRRQYEVDLRPDTFRVTQDGAVRVAERGDLVAITTDVLSRYHGSARVVAVVGTTIIVDDDVVIALGRTYAVRYRVWTAEDTIGSSVVRTVAADTGTTRSLTLLGDGAMPAVGDIVAYGLAGLESFLAKVRSEEKGEDNSVTLHMVAAAPEIDELTDAEIPPAWSGRTETTGTGSTSTPTPATPVFVGVASGLAGTTSADGLMVVVQAGSGSPAPVRTFEIQHRRHGTSSWTTISVAAAAGGTAITGYSAGDDIDLRARAISIYAVASSYTSVIRHVIGSADPAAPDVSDLVVSVLGDGRRRYEVTIAAGDVAGFRLRARPGTIAGDGWTWSDLEPLHTGLLTASPWETSDPATSGPHVIGAVAVDADGHVSRNPKLVEAML